MKYVKHLSLALAMLIHFVSFGQLKTITGQVADDQGTLLPGAYIAVKGTKKYVTSDLDGKFSMSVNIGSTLSVSYIGYQTKEVVVGKANHYPIQLNAEAKVLDEVVITQGYRLVTKKTSVAATSVVVSGKKIENRPNANVIQTLQGQIAGTASNYKDEKNNNDGKSKNINSQPDEEYGALIENVFESPRANPLSTFSIDVDNASYTNIRRMINSGPKSS